MTRKQQFHLNLSVTNAFYMQISFRILVSVYKQLQVSSPKFTKITKTAGVFDVIELQPLTTIPSPSILSLLSPLSTHLLHLRGSSFWRPAEWSYSFPRILLGDVRRRVLARLGTCPRPFDFAFSRVDDDILHTTYLSSSLIINTAREKYSKHLSLSNSLCHR